jgi:hypothetical protein
MRRHFTAKHSLQKVPSSRESTFLSEAQKVLPELRGCFELATRLSFKRCPCADCPVQGKEFITVESLMRHVLSFHFRASFTDDNSSLRSEFFKLAEQHQSLLRCDVEAALNPLERRQLRKDAAIIPARIQGVSKEPSTAVSGIPHQESVRVAQCGSDVVQLVRYAATIGAPDAAHYRDDRISRRFHINGDVSSLDFAVVVYPGAVEHVCSIHSLRRMASPAYSLADDSLPLDGDTHSAVSALVISLRRCLQGLRRVKAIGASLGGVRPTEITRDSAASTAWFIQWTPRASVPDDIDANAAWAPTACLDRCLIPADGLNGIDVDVYSVAVSHMQALERLLLSKNARCVRPGKHLQAGDVDRAAMNLFSALSFPSLSLLIATLVPLTKPGEALELVDAGLERLGRLLSISVALPSGEFLPITVWTKDSICGAQLHLSDALARKFGTGQAERNLQLVVRGDVLGREKFVEDCLQELALGKYEVSTHRERSGSATREPNSWPPRIVERSDERVVHDVMAPRDLVVRHKVETPFPQSAYELVCRILDGLWHVRNPLHVVVRFQGRVVDDNVLQILTFIPSPEVDVTLRPASFHRVPAERLSLPAEPQSRFQHLATGKLLLSAGHVDVLVESNVPRGLADEVLALVGKRLRPFANIVQPVLVACSNDTSLPVSVGYHPAPEPCPVPSERDVLDDRAADAADPREYENAAAESPQRARVREAVSRCIVDLIRAVDHLHTCKLAHGSLDHSIMVARNGPAPTMYVLLQLTTCRPLTPARRAQDHRALADVIVRFFEDTKAQWIGPPPSDLADAVQAVRTLLKVPSVDLRFQAEKMLTLVKRKSPGHVASSSQPIVGAADVRPPRPTPPLPGGLVRARPPDRPPPATPQQLNAFAA